MPITESLGGDRYPLLTLRRLRIPKPACPREGGVRDDGVSRRQEMSRNASSVRTLEHPSVMRRTPPPLRAEIVHSQMRLPWQVMPTASRLTKCNLSACRNPDLRRSPRQKFGDASQGHWVDRADQEAKHGVMLMARIAA